MCPFRVIGGGWRELPDVDQHAATMHLAGRDIGIAAVVAGAREQQHGLASGRRE